MTDGLNICPAPECEFSMHDTSELAAHVNVEHPGEYNRPDWPDHGDV